MARDSEQILRNIMAQVNALDAKMRVVAQRMKIIERNEQIIGKTLITHNKNIKELEMKLSQLGGVSQPSVPIEVPDVEELKENVQEIQKDLEEVKLSLKTLAKGVQGNTEMIDKIREELNEVKYVIDNINPVAYVTVDQVRELVEEMISRKLKK